MNLDLSHYKVSPFVLVFLKDYDDKILFLKRSPNKEIFPGKISGIGGKVEPGESIKNAARREFEEETGLRIDKLLLKGTYLNVVADKGYINISNIFLATRYFGDLKINSDEGKLFWADPHQIVNNPDLVNHVKHYLLQATTEESDFYSGIGVVNNWKLVQYTDNRGHFQSRKPR